MFSPCPGRGYGAESPPFWEHEPVCSCVLFNPLGASTMEDQEVLQALIGGIASAIVSLAAKPAISHIASLRDRVASVKRFQIFTAGLALTALGISVFPLPPDTPRSPDVRTAPSPDEVEAVRLDVDEPHNQNQSVVVLDTTVVAHTPDPGYGSTWPNETTLIVPRVPDPARFYEVTSLTCPPDFLPITVWRQIAGSHPSLDTFYSVDGRLSEGKVFLGLRAREGGRGYAYIRVYLLCSRTAIALSQD